MYKKSVLLVTADASTRKTLTETVLSHGYGVLEADGGRQAVARASLDLPSLVCVDVDLPDRRGWLAIKLLSESPRTEAIPVVVLSTTGSEGDRAKASLLGCAGFFRGHGSAEAAVALAKEILGPPRVDSEPEAPSLGSGGTPSHTTAV